MNDYLYQEVVRDAVKPKFGGKKEIVAKGAQLYPMCAEREYKRLMNEYMLAINKELKIELPKIMRQYQSLRLDSAEYREDSLQDFERQLKKSFYAIYDKLSKKFETMHLEARLRTVASTAKNTAYRNFKATIGKTLSINLNDDYYNGEFYREEIERWVSQNLLKIKTIPQEALDKMHSKFVDAYRYGQTSASLAKELQKDYDMTKRHAQLFARDQLGNLSSDMAKRQQQSAGITKYIWCSSNDERVRDSHREFNGKTFEWANPPEAWYETKSRGRVYTGKYYHPAEDYCCRCTATPVIDIDTLNIVTAINKVEEK